MRRERRGILLVELLVAFGILATALLAVYGVFDQSFTRLRKMDRRSMADAIALDLQNRYFHTAPETLLEQFGNAGGSREALAEDEVLEALLPEPLDALERDGYHVEAFAAPLERAQGGSGVYFMSKVSWRNAHGGTEHVVQARILASGLALEDTDSPLPPRARLSEAPLVPHQELYPLADAKSGKLRARGKAIAEVLAGKARDARVYFDGSGAVAERLRALALAPGEAPPPASSRASGRSYGVEASEADPFEDPGAPSPVRAEVAPAAALAAPADGKPILTDPAPFLASQGRRLSFEESRRLVPGQKMTRTQVAALWHDLERRRVPPGVYRYTVAEYLHDTGPVLVRLEVFTLHDPRDPGTRYHLIARREVTAGRLTGAFLEGDAVVSRAVDRGHGAPVTVERTATRAYLTRPQILEDGTAAPFGRELAVVEVAKDAKLPEVWSANKAAPRAEDPVAEKFLEDGSHGERIDVPLFGDYEVVRRGGDDF